MKNNIVVVFSSHLTDNENNDFIKHIDNTIGVKHKIVSYKNFNQYSLTEVYNNAINEHYEKDSIFVMLHNDIIIKTMNWGKILLQKYNNFDYDIIGLAGTTFLSESGVWWEDKSKMYGIVEHTNGIETWTSEYSNKINGIKDVVLIDGVFITFNPDTIACKFDENFKGYHFYDANFSVDNYLEGCNIGVITDIKILHKSIGETNKQWDDNRKQFIEKFKDELPIKHKNINKKPKVLICCQFFKNYTGSEMSNYELSKELVKLGCDITVISTVTGDPLLNKAKNNGVKVYNIVDAPNYRLIDKKFNFIKNEVEFDIIHINHKPIGELILQLYPNTPSVMHVRSEVIPMFEEPIINSEIKKYISIRDSITEYIKSFNINEDDIILIDNPFDTTRFNTKNNKVNNDNKICLFVGTIDYLRKNILYDLVNETKNKNEILWIIGSISDNYLDDLLSYEHVKYFGVCNDVENYIKKCDYTAGIFKGRTTIEGFLCGKPGLIYTVDVNGNILNKELKEVPEDLYKYDSNYSANKVLELYNNIINNY